MSDDAKILALSDIRAAFPEGAPRYAHIVGVVSLANEVESAYKEFGGKLKLAALYHDIGYSAQYRVTGFHPVDGAMAARKHGLSEEIAQAILYHGGSWKEAQLLRPDLKEYYADQCQMMATPLSRAMTYCDLHTGPNGEAFSVEERLADIRQRHAANQPLLQVMHEYEDRFKMIAAEWQAIIPSSLLTQKASGQYGPR
jgi:putative nucleotidyltransferase with HDIG domain